MVYVDNGMPKSGSTLLMYYMVELLNLAFPENGYSCLCQYTSDGRLPGISGFVSTLDEETIPVIRDIAEKHGPVVLKTHVPLNEHLQKELESAEMMMFNTFRDPRDVVLSMIDHANRKELNPELRVFDGFGEFEKAVNTVKHWAGVAASLRESGLVHCIPYSDLLQCPLEVLNRLCIIAGFSLSESQIYSVVETEINVRRPGINQFNKGQVTRYESEMDSASISYCNQVLGAHILRLGFEL